MCDEFYKTFINHGKIKGLKNRKESFFLLFKKTDKNGQFFYIKKIFFFFSKNLSRIIGNRFCRNIGNGIFYFPIYLNCTSTQMFLFTYSE